MENPVYVMLRNKYPIGNHYSSACLTNLFGSVHVDMEMFNQKLTNPNLATWADYALSTFKDYGSEDATIKGDLLDENMLGQWGKFDVIEHVNDVPWAMKNMVQLLNWGGILVIQMPNKDSLSNVMADGHFYILGITLLKHPDARRHYHRHFPYPYNVGEYYQQEYYLKLLTDLGREPLVRPSRSGGAWLALADGCHCIGCGGYAQALSTDVGRIL